MTVKYDDGKEVSCYWLTSRGDMENFILPREMLELRKPKDDKEKVTVEKVTDEHKHTAMMTGIRELRFNETTDRWFINLGDTAILVEWMGTDEYKVIEAKVCSIHMVDEKGLDR